MFIFFFSLTGAMLDDLHALPKRFQNRKKLLNMRPGIYIILCKIFCLTDLTWSVLYDNIRV